ncbi:MAG: Transcriptional regulator [Rhodoglobus sp.]|nr:Transcriptional regulator [Rhodoglobus sp.]
MSEKAASVNAWEALFRAQVSVLRQLNKEFPVGDLSFNEYDVLFNLSRQPGWQLRIRDLNQHLLLTQPSVSRLVDRLVGKALVRKEPDPGDGRGTIVCLTEAGYAMFRKVAVTHADSIHRRMGSLTTPELETLTALSDKLRLNPPTAE